MPPPAPSISSAVWSKSRPSRPLWPAVCSSRSGQLSLSFERGGDGFRGAFDRGAERLAFLGAGVEDDAGGADPVADPQGVGERGQGLLAQLFVFAGAVDQVDGVDHHGFDLGGVHRLAEGGEVLLAVFGRPPHARALVEDLDRFATALLAALDRFGEPTRRGDVRSDRT